jgi:hypothetical protein
MLIELQITERRERAAGAIAKVLKRPAGAPYGDYSVKSASGRTCRLAMRGPALFENYCSCPDFGVNTLGTCKHKWERQLLGKLRRGQDPLNGVLKTKLMPYQTQAPFSPPPEAEWSWPTTWDWARRVQALAAAELLRRRRGIARVLVVAPASVKYQWKTEIETAFSLRRRNQREGGHSRRHWRQRQRD